MKTYVLLFIIIVLLAVYFYKGEDIKMKYFTEGLTTPLPKLTVLPISPSGHRV